MANGNGRDSPAVLQRLRRLAPERARRALPHLVDNGRQVNRDTFLRRAQVGQEPARVLNVLGRWTHEDAPFGPWPEPWDYHIAYFVLPGWPVAWYVHSAVEYVFAEAATIPALSRREYDLRAAA